MRDSNVREIVIVARRGALDAAYTTSELLSLSRLEHVDVVTRPDEVETGIDEGHLESRFGARRKLDIARAASSTVSPQNDRTINFRYLLTPVAINGDDAVSSVTFHRTATAGAKSPEEETIEATLVLFATGYRGSAMVGVPFDEPTGTIPNDAGRVLEAASGQVVPRMYCTGWAKRGATGVIGSNRVCSAGKRSTSSSRTTKPDASLTQPSFPKTSGTSF